MGEVIQLQGDQRKDVQEFLTDKKEGLELDAKTIKVCQSLILQQPELKSNRISRSTVSKLNRYLTHKPSSRGNSIEVCLHETFPFNFLPRLV